ncbi:O-antigen ligase family protein [Clostridium felsineum]|uniref:O-antigen ligase family protein n=1 Tax=Clostridium felsineum TaxID=36839 RepID=UPI00214D7A60|nr:O-antigen ligase family protein [Clostridium felsineum]MCR3757919.1 O-antigen ligase family protein [Clostridium felsineum]
MLSRVRQDKLGQILLNIFIVFSTFEIIIKGILTLREDSLLSVNAIKIGLVVALIFSIFITRRLKRMTPKIKEVMIIYLIFFVVLALKLLAINNPSDFTKWLADNNNFNYLFSFVCFIIIININVKKESIINTLILSSIVVMGFSFLFFIKNNYYGLVAPNIIQAYSMGFLNKIRMMSVFASPNHAGLYFVMVYLIVDYREKNSFKMLFNLYRFLLVICIMLTLSRTAIGILFLYLIIKILKHKKGRKVKKVLITTFIIGIASTAVWIAITKYNVYFFSASYIQADNRWVKWQVALEYIKKYWAIGVPFNVKVQMYTYVNSVITIVEFSDNLFLEIASRFGAILILAVFAFIIKNLYVDFREKNITDINKILFFIISSMTTGSIHFTVPMILFIVYCTKFHGLKYER